jgi:hypothetical protein
MQFIFLPLPAAGESPDELCHLQPAVYTDLIPGRTYNDLSSAPHIWA